MRYWERDSCWTALLQATDLFNLRVQTPSSTGTLKSKKPLPLLLLAKLATCCLLVLALPPTPEQRWMKQSALLLDDPSQGDKLTTDLNLTSIASASAADMVLVDARTGYDTCSCRSRACFLCLCSP